VSKFTGIFCGFLWASVLILATVHFGWAVRVRENLFSAAPKCLTLGLLTTYPCTSTAALLHLGWTPLHLRAKLGWLAAIAACYMACPCRHVLSLVANPIPQRRRPYQGRGDQYRRMW